MGPGHPARGGRQRRHRRGGPAAAQGLDVAVRPSQDLTFSPLALTGNGGKTWDTGLVDASVAAVPDALALGGGRMLVLLGDGAIDQAATSGAGIPGEGVSGAAQPSASAPPPGRGSPRLAPSPGPRQAATVTSPR